MADWKADSAHPSVTANQVIFFAIPVTFGQTVEFGFYANYMVTSGDSADTTVTTQSVDPPSLSYGGPGYEITSTGDTIGNLSFGQSAFGFDYSQSFAPEPASPLLMLAAIPLAIVAGRRKARTRDRA